MIQFGDHFRASANEHERAKIRQFFVDVLECELQSTDNITANIPENIDLFFFTSGQCYGVEYCRASEKALSLQQHYLACWLELKTDDVDTLRKKCLDHGAKEITDFWDTEHFYFHAPGGQVFRLVGMKEGQN